MAGWIKIPLGSEVGLGPGDVVLDGDPVPPKRGRAPSFRLMSVVCVVMSDVSPKWLDG